MDYCQLSEKDLLESVKHYTKLVLEYFFSVDSTPALCYRHRMMDFDKTVLTRSIFRARHSSSRHSETAEGVQGKPFCSASVRTRYTVIVFLKAIWLDGVTTTRGLSIPIPCLQRTLGPAAQGDPINRNPASMLFNKPMTTRLRYVPSLLLFRKNERRGYGLRQCIFLIQHRHCIEPRIFW